jgi:glycerol kinase
VWERASGAPIHRAIVWQCRRTAPMCDRLRAEGVEGRVRGTTGLVLDAYFSGTKIRWLLDEVPGHAVAPSAADLAFGTVDSWLVWKLTGGRVHATDATNASRTLCLDLRTGDWSNEMLRILGVPRAVLPAVAPSSGVFGETVNLGWLPRGVPIAGIAGDQQAALFGQACLAPGAAKNTYGTGASCCSTPGPSPSSRRTGS